MSYIKKQKETKWISTVIVGGGISGLTKAYSLYKQGHSPKEIILFESNNRFGGRIRTDTIGEDTIEYGAGRINGRHIETMRLITEMGLDGKLVPIDTNLKYYVGQEEPYSETELRDIFGVSEFETLAELWNWAYEIYKHKQFSENTSVYSFLQTICSLEELKWIEHTFPYGTELYHMNIHIALPSIIENFQHADFYFMKGGLKQLVDALVERLTKSGVRLHTNHYVSNIHAEALSQLNRVWVRDLQTNQLYEYQYDNIVFTIPPSKLHTIPFFHRPHMVSMLKRIDSIFGHTPLCRVYAKYPKLNNGKNWFDGLDKCLLNNGLGLFIPYRSDTGVCMISYSEGEHAKYWNGKTTDKVHSEIRQVLSSTFQREIPEPIWCKVAYWDIGCHYWKSNIDIDETLTEIHRFLKPYSIYFIGEAWSVYPGWICVET